jgi:hypothetical protein
MLNTAVSVSPTVPMAWAVTATGPKQRRSKAQPSESLARAMPASWRVISA